MAKFLLHSFLSLTLLLASFASSHHHEPSESVAIEDISESDSHCDLCAVKFALQNCDAALSVTIETSLPKFISFLPSFSSPFVFHASLRLPSRAPPLA